jgi:alpha-methylacyl-CoA racemase
MLQDCTIIDFSRLLPGPLATQMLAQLGARVLKVEHPQRGDLAKFQPPFVDGQSSLYRLLNFNKTIWEIDYQSPPGREDLLEKIRHADAFIEQFRPGAMAGMGLDYETLKTINPRLVYVSLSGYGQEGDLAQAAGHDLNYLAESGILSLNTDASGRPILPGVQMADIAGGAYGTVMACLAGLLAREKTGQGGYYDVGMFQAVLPLLSLPASQHFGGLDPYGMNMLSGGLVNYNVYRCADGRWIALGALEIKFWNNFCSLVDRPNWQRQNHFELSVHSFPQAEVEDLFLQKNMAEWLALSRHLDVCLSPVRRLDEVLPDLEKNGSIHLAYEGKDENIYAFRPPFHPIHH